MTPAQALARIDVAITATVTDMTLRSSLARLGLDDWSNGGCAIYALGLCDWLGGDAHLIGVLDEADAPIIDHIATHWRGWYFDAYGVRDESDFLFDAETIGAFQIPRIVPITGPADAPAITFDTGIAKAVTAALWQRLDATAIKTALSR